MREYWCAGSLEQQNSERHQPRTVNPQPATRNPQPEPATRNPNPKPKPHGVAYPHTRYLNQRRLVFRSRGEKTTPVSKSHDHDLRNTLFVMLTNVQ